MTAMRHFTTAFLLVTAAVAGTSCGDVARSGRAPVYLVIERLEGSSGPAGTMSTFVLSDVLTNDSIVNDAGRVTLRTAARDIGTPTAPSAPSSNNAVTINRYRVQYRRADGRNTQGVDVPYAFEGAATGTIPASGSLALGFELVRHVAKMEAPLVQLKSNPTVITTIADVTFYGQDLVGNDVSVSGSIQVDFGNFADGNAN